jgi:carbon-monoxide dehydrogenase medium subunit
MWNDFVVPRTIDEALNYLKDSDGRARVMAGGTDFLIQLREENRKIDRVVYIMEIPSVRGIELKDGMIRIGAGVTFSEAIESEIVSNAVPSLKDACLAVGCPSIRNQGTVVGNIINAAPAADAAVMLFSLGAELELVSLEGLRIVPIEEAYLGVLDSSVDSTSEMVQAIRFPFPPRNCGSAFVRISPRKSLSLPILVGGFSVEIHDEVFKKVAITLGPVAPIPCRMKRTEEVLLLNNISEELIQEASLVAKKEASPRDSVLRGSSDIRKAMIKGLVRRGLEIAIARARNASLGNNGRGDHE